MPRDANAIVLPSLSQKLLLGLDIIALTPSPRFFGIKNIPPGWHFLYAGANSALSIRNGYWLHIPTTTTEPWVRIFKWNTSNEHLEQEESVTEIAYWQRRLLDSRDKEAAVAFLPYHIDTSDVAQRSSSATTSRSTLPPEVDLQPLTSCVTPALLAQMTGAVSAKWSDLYSFSTSSSSPEDRDEIPGLSHADRNFTTGPVGAILGEERELSFLGIDLKRTWQEDAVGRERTIDAQDRSAALERIVDAAQVRSSRLEVEHETLEADWGSIVVGEMQVTFLMVLLVANWSCLEEWKRILELVFTCRRLVSERPAFFTTCLRVLRLQLQRCDDVEGGLFDVSGESAGFLKQHLRAFRSTIRDLEGYQGPKHQPSLAELRSEMQELEDWTQKEWDWTLDTKRIMRAGTVQLEDGESLEVQLHDFDADDEMGEYAPVLVHCGKEGHDEECGITHGCPSD